MASKNPRINVTVDPTMVELLSAMADQECKSVSNLAAELIGEALERREDMFFSRLAEQRDSETVEKISHEDAWK